MRANKAKMLAANLEQIRKLQAHAHVGACACCREALVVCTTFADASWCAFWVGVIRAAILRADCAPRATDPPLD